MKNLKVYKSSAGSGKTTTLVKEYIFLVISNPDKYNRVLAITFTNKAADEMKQRIVEYLEALTKFDSEKSKGIKNYFVLLQIVQALYSSAKLKEHDINRRAEKVLERILHNYSEFAVSTIDSLMHRVIRSFAFDLRLPQNFEVALESEDIVDKAVDLLLDDIGSDKEFASFIIDFLEKNVDSDKQWRIDKILKDFAKILHREDGMKYVRKLHDIPLRRYVDIDKKLAKHINAFEKYLFDIGKEAMSLMKDIPAKAFYRGGSGIYKYFERFSKKDFSSPAGNSYSLKFVYEDKHFGSKITADEKIAIEQIVPDLVQYYKSIEVYRDKHEEKYFLYSMIRKNLFSMAVLQKIEKYLIAVKSENDIVHISEFNKRIAEVVKQPVPFIYERLGEKYENYFIDEFQDTSVLQWNNLLPLVENGLANGNMSLIVGDGKQAIYRWRGGEVEQFSKLPEIYDPSGVADPIGTGNALKANYNFKSLNDNYRSKENIVSFNNDFFSFVKENYFLSDLKNVYDDHNQNPKKKGGTVSISFVEEKNNKNLHLDVMMEHIHSIVEQGNRYSDIAVLCRSNSDGVLVSKKLLENNIDVISAESLLLSSSPDLHFIMAILSLINNPDDKNAKVDCINYLHNKGDKRFDDIHDALKKYISIYKHGTGYTKPDFLRNIGVDTEKWILLPIYDLCEQVIREFHIHEKPNSFITVFLDNVLNLVRLNSSSIQELLEWWDEKKSKVSIKTPEGMNAVRVWTIHKSKGLEFPIVIFPFVSGTTFKITNKEKWFDYNDDDFKDLKAVYLSMNKEIAETRYKEDYDREREKSFLDEVNVTYVAFTRPSEQLHIISDPVPKKPERQMSYLLQAFLVSKGLYDSNSNKFIVAGVSEVIEHNKEIVDTEFLEKSITSDWKEKIRISPIAPEVWDIDSMEESKTRGKIIHAMLAEIISEEDIDKVVDKYFNNGVVEENDVEPIRKMLWDFVSNKDVKRFFNTSLVIKNEKEILTSNGKIIRPDKLIFEEEQISVIDYKTGKEEESHKKQITEYANVLSQMGYCKVKKYLLYINGNKVVEV